MENKSYYSDKIRAVDAKLEAQKIAFSPMTFQAVRALIELGLLQKISDAGDDGISIAELSQASGISLYGVGVLCEMALKTHLSHLNMKYKQLVMLDMVNQGKLSEMERNGELVLAERLDINEHLDYIDKLKKIIKSNKI